MQNSALALGWTATTFISTTCFQTLSGMVSTVETDSDYWLTGSSMRKAHG